MKYMRTVLFVTLALLGAQSVSAQQNENFHIYLAFGQSNMEGTGEIDTQDKLTNSRIKLIQNFTCPNLEREYGQWYIATPPLFGCWGKLSVADYFARGMLEHLSADISIGIVPAAVGGADIALFQKSAPIGRGKAGPEKVPGQFSGGYAWLLDLAKKAQKKGVIKGMIFHQGETNTNDPQWKYKVQEIVSDLRSDLKLADIPFLAGELLYSSEGGCCSSHNSEISQLRTMVNNVHVVSAEELSGVDNAHFSASAYREFGRRYANIMYPLVSETHSKSE